MPKKSKFNPKDYPLLIDGQPIKTKCTRHLQSRLQEITSYLECKLFINWIDPYKVYLHVSKEIGHEIEIERIQSLLRLDQEPLITGLSVSVFLPPPHELWGFVGTIVSDCSHEVKHAKPRQLTQMQKDALDVHTTKLEIELTKERKRTTEARQLKEAELRQLEAAFYKSLLEDATKTIPTTFKEVVANLEQFGIISEIKLDPVAPINVRTQKVIEQVDFTLIATPKATATASYKPKTPDWDPEDTADLDDDEDYDSDGNSDGKYAHIMNTLDEDYYNTNHIPQPSYHLDTLMYSGIGSRKSPLALISVPFTYTLSSSLKSQLNTIREHIAAIEDLRTAFHEATTKLNDLPKLERLYMAALAEGKLLQSEQGKELLSTLLVATATITIN